MTFGIEVKENEGAKERGKEGRITLFFLFFRESRAMRGARWDGSKRAGGRPR